MGNCLNSGDAQEKKEFEAAKEINKKIEAETEQMIQEQKGIIKLLILGAGESGKSTLLKQMITCYGSGFGEVERLKYKKDVVANVIEYIKTLVLASDELHKQFNTRISPDLDREKQHILNLPDIDYSQPDDNKSVTLDAELANIIQRLWQDPGIQKCYEHRALLQLPDSAHYHLNRLDVISRPDYVPSYDDVLRIRVRTTGVVKNQFFVSGSRFEVYDVGGQKSERKKWIHCFEGVTAVIFVVAISEYDQTMYEDNSVNRLQEALELFESTAASPYFRNTSMILFLNKTDLFFEKIPRIPLATCFPDYQGAPDSVEEACKFIEGEFCRRYTSTMNKDVYSHFTTATNTDHMRKVLISVQDMILKQSLVMGGLV